MTIESIIIWYFICCFFSYGIIFGDLIGDEQLLADCKGDERLTLSVCRSIAFLVSLLGPVSLLRAMVVTRCKRGMRWSQ